MTDRWMCLAALFESGFVLLHEAFEVGTVKVVEEGLLHNMLVLLELRVG